MSAIPGYDGPTYRCRECTTTYRVEAKVGSVERYTCPCGLRYWSVKTVNKAKVGIEPSTYYRWILSGGKDEDAA